MTEEESTNSAISSGPDNSSSGYTPQRLASVPSLDNISPAKSVVINEKILPNAAFVRTNSRRRRRATLLRFVRLKNRGDVARVQLLLCNISERPLRFKLKSEGDAEIAALPSGKGCVSSRGSARLVLTWRRPKQFTSWERAPQPKLLLITQFMDGANPEENKLTATRFIARIFGVEECDANKPPVEQLMLDAGENTKRASTQYDRSEEMNVTRLPLMPCVVRSYNFLATSCSANVKFGEV